MKKKVFNLLLIFAAILPMTIYADNRVINGNDFDVYSRTKEDIANKWKIGQITRPDNIYEVIPSYSSPYKAGVVKQSYLDEIIDNLNYYRYLVGSPEITIKTSNDNELQTAEVVQTLYVKSTNSLTHYLYNDFTKPSDMDENFYNLGANANHNIISYGMPTEPNFFFFDESQFDQEYPTAGHRMALLSPEIAQVDYGIGQQVIYGRTTMSYKNYSNMTNAFAAYPSPGYFPKQDFATVSDWDIFLNVDEFMFLGEEYEKKVKVTIKNLSTGVIETRSVEDGNLYFDYYCYGNSCMPYHRLNIKQPSKAGKYYDGKYEVYVENLVDKNGEFTDLKYTVEFYNKLEGTESNIKSVDFELNLDKVYYDGDYDENLLQTALGNMGVDLTLENGSVAEAVANKFNIRYYGTAGYGTEVYHAYPIIDKLPSWAKDTNNILNNTYLTIRGGSIDSTYKFVYGDINYKKGENEKVTLSIKDLKVDYDGTVIYYWVKEKDGIFYELEDANKYSTDGLNLNINNLTKEDEGNYYLTALLIPDQYNESYYYLSKPLNLKVNKLADHISFDKEKMNMIVNDKNKLSVRVNPIDADVELTWYSSNPDIASVDSEGNISALKEGTVTITAKSGSLSTSIEVTVNKYMKGDLNRNSKIDLNDIILLLKRYLGTEQAKEEDIKIGDMDDSGDLGLKDVIALLRLYLGTN